MNRYVLLLLSLSLWSVSATTTAATSASADQKAGRTILVAGATGRQGGAVARALLQRGYQVRGLTRNPGSDRAKALSELGIEVVKGDFEDAASLDRAMVGVHGAFAVQNFWEHGYEAEVRQGKSYADAAKRANVQHFVFSSVASANRNTGIPHFDSKFEIENHIRRIELPHTILRPVGFMESWEYSREAILAGTAREPLSPDTRMQEISVRDIGRFAAEAFDNPKDWLGRAVDIAGAQHTMREAYATLSRVIGRPVSYEQVSWADYEKENGPEFTVMMWWFETTGYSADLAGLQTQYPDLVSLEEYLRDAGWANTARPHVSERPTVPADKGYLVEEIKDGVYWLTDGHYQMMFVTTAKGVIVVDAPRSLADKIRTAMAEVTDLPVTHLIYSHFHADHIGAAHIFGDGIEIIAQRDTLRLLLEAADPNRPLPTVTFDDEYALEHGGQSLTLSYTGPNHESGNIIIYVPAQKVLMMVDVVWPGWVPFQSIGLADHVPGIMRSMDDLLTYDFDTFVGGHADRLGVRADLEAQKEYLTDIRRAAQAAYDEIDFGALIDAIGWQRRWQMFGEYYDQLAENCSAKVVPKWRGRLADTDSFTAPNCKKMAFSLWLD